MKKALLPLLTALPFLTLTGGSAFASSALPCPSDNIIEFRREIDNNADGQIDSIEIEQSCKQTDDPDTIAFYDFIIFWSLRSIQLCAPVYFSLMGCGIFRRFALSRMQR
jgi:hypothetical protein